jgi:hypothetical protein
MMAKRFGKQAKLMQAQRRSPLVVKNDTTKNAELRVRVRVLASHMKKITGDYRYGNIATIVNVALQLNEETSLSEGTVRNWCEA